MPLLHGGRIQPIQKTNIEYSWRNSSSWKRMIDQSFRSTWENYTRVNFTNSTMGWEWEVIQCCRPNKNMLYLLFQIWTTLKSAKSPVRQPLHKSPIHPPKSIKDRLKNFSPIKPKQLKQKSQVPISQAGEIQMNTKMKNQEVHSKCPQEQSHL